MRIRVVSDLHMYCRRSRWEDFAPELDEAARDSDVFIFNGDTLDFKWSQFATAEKTAAAGEAYFRAFMKRHLDCRVHVNLGNHDHHYLFIEALERLDTNPAFTWAPYYCRYGDAVFLHGDAAHPGMDQLRLENYRAQWMNKERAHERLDQVYDAVFRLGIHALLPRVAFPPYRTLRQLARYLTAAGLGPGDGVRRVYFGHTHRPVAGTKHGGLRFYNGGAALRGIPFEILEAHVDGARRPVVQTPPIGGNPVGGLS